MRRRGHGTVEPTALRVVALLLACELAACVRPASVPVGVNISSDRSDYSPTARLAVALAPLHLTTETLDIVVDSGSLSVPGEVLGDTTAAMRNIYLTALLVARPNGGTEKAALSAPWRVVAQSDSAMVLDGLRRGERRALGSVRFRLAPPAGLDPGKTWLVFRITGIVVARIAQMEGGPVDVRPPREQRFRVYACADWNLAGRVDRERERQMRVSYLAAC